VRTIPDNLGRLLCVGIRGCAPGEALLERDLDCCARAGVGGVILFDRGAGASGGVRNIESAAQLRELIAHIRERLGDDVLVCVDQEGGRVARLHGGNGFEEGASACEFASLDGEAQEREAEREARQVARAGFDVNFAPCVDMAIEEESAVIAQLGRSYGGESRGVIECAQRVLGAHREAGVVACLKHFPGHGSARGDTHRGLVDITETWERQRELLPYRELLDGAGVEVGVMMAHVMHRGLDSEMPASMSRAIIEGLLRGEIGFEGVVFTDSIDMRAIAERFDAGEATVRSIAAGADVVVHGMNPADEHAAHPVAEMVRALERALQEGVISLERVERSLERIAALVDWRQQSRERVRSGASSSGA
jgi:beta-N-acetylhexosaminidase